MTSKTIFKTTFPPPFSPPLHLFLLPNSTFSGSARRQGMRIMISQFITPISPTTQGEESFPCSSMGPSCRKQGLVSLIPVLQELLQHESFSKVTVLHELL